MIMKSENLFLRHNERYYARDEHSSFHLNAHTQGFAPQTDTLEQPFAS